MAALGLSESSILSYRRHLESISDSDTKTAVRKIVGSLPWETRHRMNLNIQQVKAMMDEKLFGMEEVKNEVLIALSGALISNSKTFRPPRILLHGKPGTGKTAVAKAIAYALGVSFQVIGMNGVSTASSIVGIEAFWRNPQTGMILQALQDAEAMNPVILLDEIEKTGKSTEHGSPLDALLHVLDPSQNQAFEDLCIGMPVDISECFFIATANSIKDIPEALVDRFTAIEVPEYTVDEKLSILPYLLKQIKEEHHLATLPELGAESLAVIKEELLPGHGLREIKRKVWRLICEQALLAESIDSYKYDLKLNSVTKDKVAIKRKITSMGFV